jgi:integrase
VEKYPLLNDIRPSTLENYTIALRRHLIPFFGQMPVAAITYKTVEEFIAVKLGPTGSARFKGKPLSRIWLKMLLVILQMVLQRAVKDGHLPGNPAVRVGRFRRAEDENVDPFTGKELRAILAAAQELDHDVAAMLRVWAQTGVRAGELCALQWQDVDLHQGTALVRHTWTRRRLGPTKTGKARTVSMLHPIFEDTPEWRPGVTNGSWGAVEALRRLRVQPLAPDGFVFTRRGQPWPSQSLHREWRRVLSAAGVRYRSPEQFRHTFASTMLSRNAPLLYVQKQGGWRSATVLLRVYSQWMPPDADAVPQHPLATPAQPEPEMEATNVVSLCCR